MKRPLQRCFFAARTCAVFLASVTVAMVANAQDDFLRGDINTDGRVNWADVSSFAEGFRRLFDGEPAPQIFPCFDSLDVNDDGEVGGASDIDTLIDFLFTLTPRSYEFLLPEPFPRPGRDTTPSKLTCGDGFDEPGGATGNYRVGWDGPERVSRGDSIDILLRVDTATAIRGLSFAYVVDPSVLEINDVEMDIGALPPIDRRRLHASRYFQWRLHRFASDTADLRLLVFGVVFADSDFNPIDMPSTQGGTRDFPLLRVSGRISDTAPPGPREVMYKYSGEYAENLGELLGGIQTQFLGPDGFTPIDPIDPLDFPPYLIPVIDVGEIVFLRADSNGDGDVNLSDAVNTLNILFIEGSNVLFAPDGADANDDGELTITDAVYTLNFLFLGLGAPPRPYPSCGSDPTADPLTGFHFHCFQ